MIQLKNGRFPSSILSLFVTRESALIAMVVKRHFPLQKYLSKILTSLKKRMFSELQKGVDLPNTRCANLTLLAPGGGH